MSIDEPDKIDFFAVDREKTKARLVITDHLDWEEFDEGFHLELLQDKINAYLHFVEDGQWAKTRPDLEGVPVVIEVCAKHPPSKEALRFYRLAGSMVADSGVSLELNVTSSGTTTRF